jgi:hypothetical protein
MPLVFDRTLGELSVPRLDRKLAAARVRLDDLFADGWNCDDLPTDGPCCSCVVAIDTGVCTPAILTIRDDEEWLLWLRMPRTTWQQRKACPTKLWTRRLSNDESGRLLESLQPSIVNGGDVLHPHLVSALLGILSVEQNLVHGSAPIPAVSPVTLRLVAVPPQPPALEQCLTVLTHSKAFVVPDEDDEADVPLTQRITDHVVWGAPSNGAATAALAKAFNDEHDNLQSVLTLCCQPSVSLAHILGPSSTQEVAMKALVRYATGAPAPVVAMPVMTKTSELAPSDDDDDSKPRVVPTFPTEAASLPPKPKKRKRKDDSDDSDNDDDASESSSSVSGVSEEEDDESEEEDEEEENEPVKDDDSEHTTIPSASHSHDAERLATLLKTHGESFSTLRRNAALKACQEVAKGDNTSYSTLLSYAVGFLEDAMEERRPDNCVLIPATEAAATRAAATRLLRHTEKELPGVAQTLAALTEACEDATLVLKQHTK